MTNLTNPNPTANQWQPLSRVARRLRVRPDIVRSLIHSGYLVGYLEGRRWFIRADSLQRYIRWRDRRVA
jgi:hypothetical protein